MTNTLVWYRNDLRTIDHEPLTQAASGDQTFAVYCFDPIQFGQTRFGFERTGPFRARFLFESVLDLRNRLRALGGDLIVRVGKPSEVIGDLLSALEIDSIHFHDDPGTEEADEQSAVVSVCESHSLPKKVSVKIAFGDTLIHRDDLPFTVADTPDLFTRFRKKVEKKSHPRDPIPEPTRLACQLPAEVSAGDIPTLDTFGLAAIDQDARGQNVFAGGQSAGQERMQHYVWNADRLKVYKETRNGMLHPDDSSKFSPWLANGCLSARTIAAEVHRYEQECVANDSTYWMIFELLWRDYFRWITRKHGRDLFLVGGLQGTDLPWKQDWDRFELWRRGETGYPLVDANMQELAATGYMSNRGRQNVGSFLTKNLGIDWRMGAEWFESLLVDYDVASNYGNWNYVAGVGNDARGFRFFNITKQSRDYDREGDYARHWLPELRGLSREEIHEPWKMSRQRQSETGTTLGVNYPNPVVDLFGSAKANEAAYLIATQNSF